MSDLAVCGRFSVNVVPPPAEIWFSQKGGPVQAGDVSVRGADGRSDRGWGSEQRAARPEGRCELPRVPRVVVDDRALAGRRRGLPQRLRRAVDADVPEGRGEGGLERDGESGETRGCALCVCVCACVCVLEMPSSRLAVERVLRPFRVGVLVATLTVWHKTRGSGECSQDTRLSSVLSVFLQPLATNVSGRLDVFFFPSPMPR